MYDKRLLQKIRRTILELVDGDIVSLYVIGSFLQREMIESSDIDLIGVMKPNFNFRKEASINRALNRAIRSRHKIDLGMMSCDEFYDAPRKGSLMKHIELPIFLNFLKRAKLIYGKKISFNELPTKLASPEEEVEYHTKVFDEYEAKFRKKDEIRPDFTFRDFIKIIFYISNLELQLTRKLAPRASYSETVRAFRKNRNHVVHYSMKLRRKKTITRDEKQAWLDCAERYIGQIKTAWLKT